MSTFLNFNVSGNPKDDRPLIVADNPPGGTQLTSHFEGVSGVWPNRWVVEVPDAITGGATVYYDNGRAVFRIIVPMGGGSWEAGQPPCLPPEYNGDAEKVALVYRHVGTLPALTRVGRFWRLEGNRFFLNGATAFNALGVYCTSGEQAVRDRFKQRQDMGFNAARIWTAFDIPLIGRVVPREHGEFYTSDIPAIASLAAEYGQYPYITGLTGPYGSALGSTAQIVEHDARLMDALVKIPYALYDRRNEFSKDVNQVEATALVTPPPGLLWSQGSGQQDEDPPTPFGLFAARHPSSSEWQRKVGKQAWDSQNNLGSSIPWVDDETVRLEPQGETSTQHAHDAGACGTLFIAGAFLHSAQAKLFALFGGAELAAALAWNQGVQSIIRQGLDVAQDGFYTNVTSGEALRVYRKTLGSRSIELAIGV